MNDKKKFSQKWLIKSQNLSEGKKTTPSKNIPPVLLEIAEEKLILQGVEHLECVQHGKNCFIPFFYSMFVLRKNCFHFVAISGFSYCDYVIEI